MDRIHLFNVALSKSFFLFFSLSFSSFLSSIVTWGNTFQDMFHLSHWYSPYIYGKSPEDDLCLEIISVVLYSTSQSVVSGLRGDPLWSL